MVDSDLRYHGDARRCRLSSAALQQLLQVRFAGNHVGDAALEAVALRRIQLQGSKAIFEEKRIYHYSGGIRESSGLLDVHPPGGERTGDLCESEGLVTGHHTQFVEIWPKLQTDYNRLF